MDKSLTQINNTTFGHINKTHKGNVLVEIGDSKQPDFHPQVKLMFWDNEVNFSLRYKDDNNNKLTPQKDGSKIFAKSGKKQFGLYPLEKKTTYINNDIDLPVTELNEGGFEFEITFDDKPKSNILEFTLETKGLNFFYQPNLTREEEYEDEVSRPENVVGSYAVYHKSKRGDYQKMGGKNYLTGKAFHIYRPYVIDASDKKIWADLNIDQGNKLLTITIPQDFLDSATYPILVDPTIGYETCGASEAITSAAVTDYKGHRVTGVSGTLTKISAYLKGSPSGNWTCRYFFGNDAEPLTPNGIYQSGDLTKVLSSTEFTLTEVAIADLVISGDLNYVSCATLQGKTSGLIAYDTGTNTTGGYFSATGTPAVYTWNAENTRLYSTFATYTASSTYSGILKRYNSSSWVKGKLVNNNGGAFSAKPLKRWGGEAWVEVDATGI